MNKQLPVNTVLEHQEAEVRVTQVRRDYWEDGSSSLRIKTRTTALQMPFSIETNPGAPKIQSEPFEDTEKMVHASIRMEEE